MRTSIHLSSSITASPHAGAKGSEFQSRCINFQFPTCINLRVPATVDTKKKELVGDFKNGGREWRPRGEPLPVRVHDFLDPALGKAIPYGVYDLTNNEGW
jgi:hypothetical protein